ncbi:MAG: hypothetical protein LBN02_00750 [Oscillospiraceae bacterium]|jgi:hypothetical protein|nr:hypothetical protein [Oscillospiraceae bacterium]
MKLGNLTLAGLIQAIQGLLLFIIGLAVNGSSTAKGIRMAGSLFGAKISYWPGTWPIIFGILLILEGGLLFYIGYTKSGKTPTPPTWTPNP